MKTIITNPDATEWIELGKYTSGKADQCNTILELFENTITDELRNWLYSSRSIAREEASASYQNAIDILEKKSEV